MTADREQGPQPHKHSRIPRRWGGARRTQVLLTGFARPVTAQWQLASGSSRLVSRRLIDSYSRKNHPTCRHPGGIFACRHVCQTPASMELNPRAVPIRNSACGTKTHLALWLLVFFNQGSASSTEFRRAGARRGLLEPAAISCELDWPSLVKTLMRVLTHSPLRRTLP